MEKVGNVKLKRIAEGSKSERDAVMLVTHDREYVLARQGGNSMRDEVLEQLVGKRIRCQGVEHAYKFLVSDWDVID